MNFFEKLYAIAAIIFEIGLVVFFLLQPQYQRLSILLPACSVGLIVNIIFLFLVFRDIFQRTFDNSRTKYFWLVIILLFWPAGLVYLLRHGFKPRQPVGPASSAG
ncbi:putative membrane protein [Desulfoprunum benzoelyticum]|uniref:Putative membrane protein n=1 Tax=Desulfoprunum benzoelyticum TaxID=1506996 RepID=A0A840V590_9BACT|nr:hypothetical protein [Desulfoprunum benzoelyticum]MBB5348909.1 putative membrane protein [Desulfoprunum benzoelyticum]